MFRKCLSVFLVLAMLLTGLTPLSVLADEGTFPHRVKIVTMGDSFTAGVVEQNAYRTYLAESLIKSGAAFELTGPWVSHDFRVSRAYSRHCGIPGAVIGSAQDTVWNGSKWVTSSWSETNETTGQTVTSSGLGNNLYHYLRNSSQGPDDTDWKNHSTYGPYVQDADILTLFIGLNDYYDTKETGLSADLELTLNRYRAVLDVIFELNPDLSLYCVTLPLVQNLRGVTDSDDPDGVYAYNRAILEEIVPEYAKKGFSIHGVDLNAGTYAFVDAEDTPEDDTHPNPSGNRKIGYALAAAMKDEVLLKNETSEADGYNPVRVQNLTISSDALTLRPNEDKTLTWNLTPSDADILTVEWTSDNPTVATVDRYGRIHAVSSGTAHITATALDNAAVSAVCTVTVAGDEFLKASDSDRAETVFADNFAARGNWTGNNNLLHTDWKVFMHDHSGLRSLTSINTYSLGENFSLSFGATGIEAEATALTDANKSSYRASLTVGDWELRASVNARVIGVYYQGALLLEYTFETPITWDSEMRFTVEKFGTVLSLYRNNELLTVGSAEKDAAASGSITVETAGSSTWVNVRDVRLKTLWDAEDGTCLPTALPVTLTYETDLEFYKNHPNNILENITDGDLSTAWLGKDRWGAEPSNYTHSFLLDLGSEKLLTGIDLYWGSLSGYGKPSNEYTVIYSADGNVWKDMASYLDPSYTFTINDAWYPEIRMDTLRFNQPTSARYFRIVSKQNGGSRCLGVTEFSPIGFVSDPTPVSYTVVCEDTDGNQIATETQTAYVGTVSTVAVPSVDGYTALSNPETVRFDKNAKTVTYRYAKLSADGGYLVKYVDESGNTLHAAKSGTGNVGETVTETAIYLPGRRAVKPEQSLVISATASENVLTFVYTSESYTYTPKSYPLTSDGTSVTGLPAIVYVGDSLDTAALRAANAATSLKIPLLLDQQQDWADPLYVNLKNTGYGTYLAAFADAFIYRGETSLSAYGFPYILKKNAQNLSSAKGGTLTAAGEYFLGLAGVGKLYDKDSGEEIAISSDDTFTAWQSLIQVLDIPVYPAPTTQQPADYSKIRAALATVPADLSGYSADSRRAVEKAVAKAVDGHVASNQAFVDAIADEITAAVAALMPQIKTVADGLNILRGTLTTDAGLSFGTDRSLVFDGDSEYRASNFMVFSTYTGDAIADSENALEIDLMGKYLLRGLRIFGGSRRWGAEPSADYDVYVAGVDGVYGESVYHFSTDTATAFRTDTIDLSALTESVRYVKIVSHKHRRRLAYTEIEVFGTPDYGTPTTYTVRCVDIGGNDLIPPTVKNGYVDASVTEQAPEIPYYTAQTAEKTIALTADALANVITFVYIQPTVRPIAASAKMTENTQGWVYGNQKTVDCLFDGDDATAFVRTWCSEGTTGSIDLTLDGLYDLSSARIAWGGGNSYTASAKAYALFGSADGITYRRLFETDAAADPTDYKRVDTVSLNGAANVRYLRLCVYNATGPCLTVGEVSFGGVPAVNPPADIIRPVFAAASASSGEYTADRMIDGNPDTQWRCGGWGIGSENNASDVTLTFLLPNVTALETVNLSLIAYEESGVVKNNIDAYEIEVSSDGKNFTRVYRFDGSLVAQTGTQILQTDGDVASVFTGDVSTVKYVRIVFKKASHVAVNELYVTGIDRSNALSSKGAQIRPASDEIKAGLRFAAAVSKAELGIEGTYTVGQSGVRFGMLMIPKKRLIASGFDSVPAMFESGNTEVLDLPANYLFAQNASTVTFTGVLTDIPVSDYGTDVCTVPYVLENGSYRYGIPMVNSFLSVARVARETTYSDAAIAALTDETQQAAYRKIAEQLDVILSSAN